MASPETEAPQKFQKIDREPLRHALQPAAHFMNDLPDELLLEIATYLEGENQALGSLTQVSRCLKVIGGDLLYRTINLPRSRENNTIYLARTIIEKPDLGSKIRQLAFSTTTLSATTHKDKTDAPYLCEIILLCRCGYGVGPKEFEGDVTTSIFKKLKKLGVDVCVVEEKLGAFAAQARKEGSVWEADWPEDGWAEGLFGEEMG